MQVLSCLVGHHIAQEQVYSIVKRTMREADINEDQFISLEEFKQVRGLNSKITSSSLSLMYM